MISKIINYITGILCFISLLTVLIWIGVFGETTGDLGLGFIVYSTMGWIASFVLILIFIIKEIILNHMTVNGAPRSHSPLAKPVLVAVIIFFVGLFALVLIDKYHWLDQETPSYTIDTNPEETIINNLLLTWKTTQANFSVKAGESGTYNQPSKIQFISTNTMLVYYDDGLVDHISVIRFDQGSFKELQNVGAMSTMSQSQWQTILNTYGLAGYPVSNYQSNDQRTFIKVVNNIFV